MTAIYVTSFITGVVGNVATGVVIVRNRSMHTATNYYLFSLALSDLVILLLGELRSQWVPDILALEQESNILGRCWALSEFHISSRSFSNQFLSTVLVCGATPTNWIEGK